VVLNTALEVENDLIHGAKDLAVPVGTVTSARS
jgi:hypothetical protein